MKQYGRKLLLGAVAASNILIGVLSYQDAMRTGIPPPSPTELGQRVRNIVACSDDAPLEERLARGIIATKFGLGYAISTPGLQVARAAYYLQK